MLSHYGDSASMKIIRWSGACDLLVRKKGILAGIELIMEFIKYKLIKLIYKAIFDQNQGAQNLTL